MIKVWDVVMVVKTPRPSETGSGKKVYAALVEGDSVMDNINGPYELVDIRHVLKLQDEIELLKKELKLLSKTSWGLI